MSYIITHGRRPNWKRTAETIAEARAIIKTECGGYMDEAPHYNNSGAIELWNESSHDGCETYAIEG